MQRRSGDIKRTVHLRTKYCCLCGQKWTITWSEKEAWVEFITCPTHRVIKLDRT